MPETIIATQIIDHKIKEQIWGIYKKSFTGSEKKCAQNQQCYNEKTFFGALEDRDYTKYYIRINNQVIAYMLATNNLQKAKVTYMNPEKYMGTFSEYMPDRIYYFTSLAVDSDSRDRRFFFKLIADGLKHVASMNGMYAFDFSHETVANLANIFIKIANKLNKQGMLPKMRYQKVGVQEFGALIPK